jgi:hypothetical protein
MELIARNADVSFSVMNIKIKILTETNSNQNRKQKRARSKLNEPFSSINDLNSYLTKAFGVGISPDAPN